MDGDSPPLWLLFSFFALFFPLVFTYELLLFCVVPFGDNVDNDYPCSNFAGRSNSSGFSPS